MSAPITQRETRSSGDNGLPTQRFRELYAAGLIALVIVFGAAGRWERATTRRLEIGGPWSAAAD